MDTEISPNIDEAKSLAHKNHIDFRFIKANDLTVDLKHGVDMVFIDTWHCYPQLKAELETHAKNVRKCI